MLYVYHGTDTMTVRAKARTLLDSLQKRQPDASLVRITKELFDENEFAGLYGVQGLFVTKLIVILDMLCSDKEIRAFLQPLLPSLASSENIFIMLEEKLDAKTRTLLEKHAEKIQEYGDNEGVQQISFKIFDLSDALGKRDRRELWILVQAGRLRGISSEEMFGILLWGIKSMLLAGNAKNAKEAGLNPFVYRKAYQFSQKYSEQELKNLSSALISQFHEARRGKYTLDDALEHFVLSLP